MKHRNDKDRKRLRIEFVYKHRHQIDFYKNISILKSLPTGMIYLIEIARKELGYSVKTNDVDIYLSLRRTYLKNEIKWTTTL